MTDGPQRPDLSDAALFDGLVPASPTLPTVTEPGMQTKAAVELAMRVLLGANLRTEFGFDQGTAQRTWALDLGQFSGMSIVAAAREWANADGKEFPTFKQFETLVASIDRAAKAAPARKPGVPCPECGEYIGQPEHMEGRVNLTDPTQGGTGTSRPCSICRPEQFRLHQAGHYGPKEGTSLCRCHDPLCPDTKRLERARSG